MVTLCDVKYIIRKNKPKSKNQSHLMKLTFLLISKSDSFEFNPLS